MSNVICQSNKDLPIEMTLGNLLFYSLSDMKIAESDLVNIFQSNKIPETYVRKISKPDAFRRASSSIKNKTLYIPDPNNLTSNIKVKIEVDEVRSDSNGITRIVGKKSIDEKNESVSYDPVAELTYDRTADSYTYRLLDVNSATLQQYTDLCQEVQQNYSDWSVYHTKDTIRNTINRIITDTYPVNLTPTGLCKFVPRSHSDMLYSLKEALAEMNGYCKQGESNFMEIIPVINTDEQTELIKNASQLELKSTLFGFTQELKEVLLARQTLPARTVTSYLDRFKEMKSKVDDYENLLGNYLGFLKTQLTEAVTLVKENSEEQEEDTPVYV